MNKKIGLLLVVLMLTVAMPTNAFASPINTIKTFGGNEVVMQQDGSEIEYYKDYAGNVFTNLPKVIKTVIQGEAGNTLKYSINGITNCNKAEVEHSISDTGAYVTLNNIVKEGNYKERRIVYATGSVTIQFNGEYFKSKNINKYSEYGLDNGELMFTREFDSNTMKPLTVNIYKNNSSGMQTVELTEPGLYYLDFSATLERGIGLYVCIASSEELEMKTTETNYSDIAVANNMIVNVNGKETSIPSYKINGSNYFRIRDIAYVMNGTSKQFDVVYNAGSHTTGLNTIRTLCGEPNYRAIGGELSAIGTDNKTIVPFTEKIALNGSTINASVYTIDNWNYIKIDNLANIINFGLTQDNNKITITA